MNNAPTDWKPFDSEATQPLVPEWVRLVIRPELAPWSLVLYVSRGWLLAPEQQDLRNAAKNVFCGPDGRGPAGKPGVAPLFVKQCALVLRCPPSPSVLTIFGEQLSADTGHRPRNLSISALVRVETAEQNEVQLTLVNGSVRIEDLVRRPNIFDGLADVALVWPAPLKSVGGRQSKTEELDAILLSSADMHVELLRDSGERVRFQYRRVASDRRRLWLMVACPYRPGIVDPVVETRRKIEDVTRLLANQPVQILNPTIQGAAVLAATSYRTCTTLVSTAKAGDRTVLARDPVASDSQITLSPGRREEEIVHVESAQAVLGGYRLDLNAPIARDHAENTLVRTSGERQVDQYFQADVTIAFTNADKTTALWQPVTFYLRQKDGAAKCWTFDDADPFPDDAASNLPEDLVPTEPLRLEWDARGLTLAELPRLQLTGADQRPGNVDSIWLPVLASVSDVDMPSALIRFRIPPTESRLPDTGENAPAFSRPVLVQWTDGNSQSWTIEGQTLRRPAGNEKLH